MTPLVALQCVRGNEPTALTAAQQLLQPHVDVFLGAWWFVWIVVGSTVLWRIGTAIHGNRNNTIHSNH